jgi:O-antigen/teichoic acid export membrane protein
MATSLADNLTQFVGRYARLGVITPKGAFARRLSLLAGSTLAAQTLNFMAAPFLTRIYDANAFGHLQLYVSVMTVIGVIIALRYEFTVVLPQEDSIAASVAAVSLAAILAVTACVAVGVYLATHFLSQTRIVTELGLYLWLVPVGALGMGIYQLLVSWALRHGEYKDIALSKFSQVIVQVAVQIGAGLFSPGSFAGLIIGDTCGRISGSWQIAKVSLRRDWMLFRSVRAESVWTAAKRYRNFPLVLAPAGVINSVGLQIVVLLLSAYYGVKLVGLYAIADRTMQVPSLLIGQAVSQVYMVQAAALREGDPVELRRLFWKIVTRSLTYSVLPAFFIMAFAPSAFALVFGEEWRPAGHYARLLAPLACFSLIHQSIGTTLNVLERQTWQAAWDVMRLAAVASVLVAGATLGIPFTSELAAFVGVSCLAYMLHIALCYFAISRTVLHYQDLRLAA